MIKGLFGGIGGAFIFLEYPQCYTMCKKRHYILRILAYRRQLVRRGVALMQPNIKSYILLLLVRLRASKRIYIYFFDEGGGGKNKGLKNIAL
ncbi:hypothetical protein SAMN06295967_105188 [Belliella buryatensis]|uniref:Uncharacterized protein n=1 Tax=Belliella buryatensis TaxID=1500549 RepID=A0A239CR23_9BACT|nr:hypothetical protein SAMN06295967_105188 [Belliella buryatensis]